MWIKQKTENIQLLPSTKYLSDNGQCWTKLCRNKLTVVTNIQRMTSSEVTLRKATFFYFPLASVSRVLIKACTIMLTPHISCHHKHSRQYLKEPQKKYKLPHSIHLELQHAVRWRVTAVKDKWWVTWQLCSGRGCTNSTLKAELLRELACSLVVTRCGRGRWGEWLRWIGGLTRTTRSSGTG